MPFSLGLFCALTKARSSHVRRRLSIIVTAVVVLTVIFAVEATTASFLNPEPIIPSGILTGPLSVIVPVPLGLSVKSPVVLCEVIEP